MAARQGGSAAVVSERDGRSHIVVLRQQCGATFRARNYSLAVGFGWGCPAKKAARVPTGGQWRNGALSPKIVALRRPRDQERSMTEKTADRAMLLDEAKSLHWDYSIDLGDGVVTQGINSPDALRDQSGVVFSEPVAGKSVLDIGCWDGYLSTEAARHGAKSVLATDDFVWRAELSKRRNAELSAALVAPSVIQIKQIDVMEISPERGSASMTSSFYRRSLPHAASATGIGESGQRLLRNADLGNPNRRHGQISASDDLLPRQRTVR